MKYDVILSLRGKQTYPGNEPELIELVTEGTLEPFGNGWRILYQESELTGLEGVTTCFEIDNGRVVLDRSGKLTSRMVFQEGVAHNSLYEMEFGALMITVRSNRVSYDLSEHGGTVDLAYAIEIEQGNAGEIEYHLELKRK